MNKITILAAAIMLTSSLPIHAEELLPTSRPQVSADIDFPDARKATRPQGVFVPARHVAMIAPGMKKSEIYTLLDVPHFHEWFGPKRWNYILNFYTGQGDEYRQCQYQIRFSKERKVEGAYWRDAECASLFEKALAEPKAVERVVTEYVPAAERAIRSYSFNFDFNKSVVRPEGRDVIGQIVAEAQRGNYRRIVVTGFTDTVGSQGYNDGLAARRAAATVTELADALAAAGSPLAQQVFSRGGRDLAVDTADEVQEERNRRVLIELY